MLAELYNIPLFDILTEDEIEWVRAHSSDVTLETGEYFFREGETALRFYIVLEGELQVTRVIDGVLRVLGTTPRGIIGGELALLGATVQPSTARAIMPSRLMVFDKKAFFDIFANVQVLGMRILRIAAERMSGIATRITHAEKMAALGKFSAGLAHELNNPASAARRAAQTLYDLMPQVQTRTMELCGLGLDRQQLDHLLSIEHEMALRAQNAPPLSPMEESAREDAITDWLDEQGVADAYDAAPVFVGAGLTSDDLQAVTEPFPAHTHAGILTWLHSALYASTLLCEIDDSTTRISDLVRAVKEYTYMDQGKLQQVDVHKSLDNTVKVLAHKTKHVQIVREYDPELPMITANGGEISQVWTNLIDNAVDALQGHSDARIRLITRCETDFVMVEINDNGGGIPDHVMPHLFEPFFTTKGVGQGTGLGLDIVYRIVKSHDGTIEVQSEPGNTRFIVRLPIHQRETTR